TSPSIICCLFLFHVSRHHCHLHSFPTRRSSDLPPSSSITLLLAVLSLYNMLASISFFKVISLSTYFSNTGEYVTISSLLMCIFLSNLLEGTFSSNMALLTAFNVDA